MNFDQKLKKELGKNLKFNEPLKKWTTFRIGGPARYFFLAKSGKDLIKAVTLAKKLKIPYFILGGGSNLLCSDVGYNGLIIKIQNSKFKIQNSKILAEAGTKLSQLVRISLERKLTGLEWAAGIPGTLGGAIHGNAGWPSKRKNISTVVESVEVLKIDDGKLKIEKFSRHDCQFGYRASIFQKNNNLVILSALLKLKKGNKEKIKKEIIEILKIRQKKIPQGFSAGCIFKNSKFKIQNSKLLKEYPQLKEFKKSGIIPTGWLIEKLGLKGKKIGGAKISEKHANFIINQGGAKAKDVLKLINLIEKMVLKKFNLKLEKEIKLIGF
ncbi:MAG: UDP-N-acetylmuramate dehydrogenase [Patescibacteria group bacterium]|nr:UDP-N-acetylmuramate dehydrogenase [Patescibacteria group bacterium]